MELILRGTKLDRSDNPSPASDVSKAKSLVRRCAEPCPAGDSVKEAVNRAARRLGFSHSRTRDIWYGTARRIESHEMDQLRDCAQRSEIASAVAGLQVLRDSLAGTGAPAGGKVVAGIDAALRLLGGCSEHNDSGLKDR